MAEGRKSTPRILHQLAGCLLLFAAPVAWAITPAGTLISNTATLDYLQTGGNPEQSVSNTVSVVVDEIIDVTLTWQDASAVVVNSPDTDDVLSFLLTNTGNGNETFTLTRNDAPAVSDQYDPVASSVPIYVESNGLPGLQTGPGGDTPYSTGITLGAEQSRMVYVLSDTPSGLLLGDTGQVALAAASTTLGAAGSPPGTALADLGDNGLNAVVGQTSADADALGIYIVNAMTLGIVKTVSVQGGGDPASGKTLNYTITVTLAGTGGVDNLVVTDPMPAEVDYVPGSLSVDSSSRTDASDGDNAQFVSNTIGVNFGNTAAPVVHVIQFSVVIK